MIVYKDRTYCSSSHICENAVCRLRLFEEDRDKAIHRGLMIAYADFRADDDMCFGFEPLKVEDDQDQRADAK